MTIIAEKDRETIRELFAKELVEDVELLFFTRPRSRIVIPGRQDCETCDEARELLEELVGLSDRLSLETHDLSVEPDAATTYNVQNVPTVLLRRAKARLAEQAQTPADQTPEAGASSPPNVRYVGLPGGYEFSSLLADVVDISKGETSLSQATREAVRAIDQPVHIQVFVTPT